MAIVANFSKYDAATGEMVLSKFKMTLDAIAAEKGLVKIDGTEEDVPDEILDGYKRYDPNA